MPSIDQLSYLYRMYYSVCPKKKKKIIVLLMEKWSLKVESTKSRTCTLIQFT